MKRIYAFTLDGEDCVSSKFRSNLRLIAYLMYDSIYNYDGSDDYKALIINKNIIYNEIIEGTGGCRFANYGESADDYTKYEYYLSSDVYDDGYINYEPFLIGDRTFAITVDDRYISEDALRELLEDNLNITKLEYSYKITSIGYLSSDINDEKNRKKAIRLLFSNLGCQPVKKKLFAKKKNGIKVLVRKCV